MDSKLISATSNYIDKVPFLKIVLIIVGWFIIYLVVKFFGDSIIRKIMKERYRDKDKEALKKRTGTLHGILTKTLAVVVFFMAALMILDELGINLAPLLASAGIVGLAVSFGSQSLVKDIVSGVFILVEDQFRKGDRVKIPVKKDVEGIVEDITLRRTLIRDDDDNLYYIPNSKIELVINLEKGKKKKAKKEKEKK